MQHPLLALLGYGPELSTAFAHVCASTPDLDLVPARVTSHLGAHLTLAGARAPRAAPSGRLRHELAPHEQPAVGDWVAVRDADEVATIHHVLPRRTCLVRRAAGAAGAAQVIAANVDVFLVVTSANRDANPRRLERYLATVWDSGARPVVVVNKTDLASPAALAATVEALAAVAPGVPVVPVSAATGAGTDALAAWLAPGRTIALVGSSGVGKSSLTNRLLGDARQEVAAIDGDDRGRHATTRRELFVLPDDRGVLIDTPGMRELGLVDDDGGLAAGFADLTALAEACRFADCQHGGEPGCAVAAAIADGTLAPDRLAAWQRLEREAASAAWRRDPAAAARAKQRWKSVHVAMRARAKVDPKLRR